MAIFRKRDRLWQLQVQNKKIGSISKSFKKSRWSELGTKIRIFNAICSVVNNTSNMSHPQ